MQGFQPPSSTVRALVLVPDERAVGGRMLRKWAWVGIVLFVVADAVLIMVALKHTREGADTAPPFTPAVAATSTPLTSAPPAGMTSMSTPPPATTPPPTSIGPAVTSPSDSTTATLTTATDTAASSTTASTAGPPDSAATVLLDMASDGSAIRATRGSCSAGGSTAADLPVVQVSDDAGETWTSVDSSATAVERVAAGRSGKSWFVATDDDCTLVEHDSAGDGKDWTTSSPEGAWALPVDPTATSILAPSGDVEIGCTPVSLAAIDSKNAVVACSDGTLRTSTDSGKAWSDGTSVPGVVGISFVGANSGYALAVSEGCAAQVWQTTNGAASFSKLACLDGTAPQAITAAGSTILVQVDGAMQRSDDEGDTWSQIP